MGLEHRMADCGFYFSRERIPDDYKALVQDLPVVLHWEPKRKDPPPQERPIFIPKLQDRVLNLFLHNGRIASVQVMGEETLDITVQDGYVAFPAPFGYGLEAVHVYHHKPDTI